MVLPLSGESERRLGPLKELDKFILDFRNLTIFDYEISSHFLSWISLEDLEIPF